MQIPVHIALDLGLVARDSAGNFINSDHGTATEAAWQAQRPRNTDGETRLDNGETDERAAEGTFKADERTQVIRATPRVSGRVELIQRAAQNVAALEFA